MNNQNIQWGIGEEAAVAEIDSYLGRNRMRPNLGRSFAFYPTDPYDLTIRLRTRVQEKYGCDMFSHFTYEGGAEYIDANIQKMGQEMFGCSEGMRGGLVLPSCTSAIQHAVEIALTDDDNEVVLASEEARFLIERTVKRTEALYYNDREDLEEIIDEIYRSKRKIALNFMLGGRTTTGVVEAISRIIEMIEEKRPEDIERPFHLVDAAPHGFNMWAQDRANEIDFSNPIDALIVNPQKVGSTDGGTLFFVRNLYHLAIIAGMDWVSMPEDEILSRRLELQARASTLVSRDGTSTCAFFGTLQTRGVEWFREERQKVIDMRNYLLSLLESHPDYFSILPSDNNVIAFTTKNTGHIAREINNGEDRVQGEFIGYSFRDDILWAVTNRRHTKAHIDRFFQGLCDIIEAL